MKPKLRPVETLPIQHQGQQLVLLRDPLKLSSTTIAVPRALAPILALMDGSRDEAELLAAFTIRTGLRLASGVLARLLADLDHALLLENESSARSQTEALEAYRRAPYRPMTVDESDLPSTPEAAAASLEAYQQGLDVERQLHQTGPIGGVISPHIDYQRGGSVYAAVWSAAREAARQAELVIVFGTDHYGTDAALTLTRQSYATPWGPLPTDAAAVEQLADALGHEVAFGDELHHRSEHSIELAVVWLHFVRGGASVPLVPVLCGSFDCFLSGGADPAAHAPFEAALQVLREQIEARPTLVVAAADLAHVGPAFGDVYPIDFVERARQRAADERLLHDVCAGDAAGFFRQLRQEQDRRHVCGLPPIYLTLRLLGECTGELAGYALCPADAQGTSFVSIAGVVLH